MRGRDEGGGGYGFIGFKHACEGEIVLCTLRHLELEVLLVVIHVAY